MTLARANSLGWGYNEIFTSAQCTLMDQNIEKALDGAAGGTYAPSAAIIIGGSGLHVTGAFVGAACTLASVDIGSGAIVANSTSVAVTVDTTFSFGDVSFETGLTCPTGNIVVTAGNITVTAGDLTVTAGDVAITAGGLSVGGNAIVLGTFNAVGATTLGDTAATSFTTPGSGVVATGTTLNTSASCVSTFAGLVNLSGGAALTSVLAPSGTGRIKKRVHVVTDAASNTFGINDGDIIVIPSTAAARSWTLTSTGAQEDDVIRLTAYAATAFDVTILDDGASPIITLRMAAANIPWCDLHFKSGAWRYDAFAYTP